MSPTDARGWRYFWHERGERELATLLAEAWPPARGGDATRIATLLGSRASAGALAKELRRMRAEHGEPANDAEDADVGARVSAWFLEAAAA
ncbi:MAG TPA: hypothetical protein VF002_10835 [Gaiellaceae bacterium]